MIKWLSLSQISFALLLASCGSNTPGNTQTAKTTGSNPPVENRKPVTDFKPAFEGQTRAPGITTATPYEGKIITTELKRPWGIANLPNGNFIITEKAGVIRIVTPQGTVGSPISGVPKVNSGGQGGLLDIALDPDFGSNRMVYWTYSEPLADGNVTAVAKGKLSADEKNLEEVTVIYRALPTYRGNNHYGSRILFDKKGNLYVSTGDRFDRETRPQAQWLNSALGKIVRITKDGKPAAGNPFANNAEAKAEIYSYGHRNVQSLAFHPQTGQLWEAEFGPQGGDELNLIEAGKNYGWPIITYGEEYGGATIGRGITQQAGMEQPVYYWDPVLSPSGMTFYTGDNMPEWKNNLFIAGLNSNHIARLVLKNNKVAGEERILANEGQRFRDVIMGRDGAMYAITDEGRLYRIARK